MDRCDGGFGQIPPAATETLIDFLSRAVISLRAFPFIVTPGANPFVFAATAIDIPRVLPRLLGRF